jgi:DNA repair protein RadA/Sms
VYVNVAGGLRFEEPAADLAVALALASSLRDRPVQPATVLAGEIALSGRLRAATRGERRAIEATRLGFARMVTGPMRGGAADGSRAVVVARDVREAIGLALQD